MRIHFPEIERPKAAAKLIVRGAGGLKLSLVQEVLARAAGYRDWHELTQAGVAAGQTTAPPSLSVERIKGVVLAVSDALGTGYENVQFALAKSRFLGEPSLEMALHVRTSIWRDRLFGASARKTPGTIIKVKARGFDDPAYLKSLSGPAYLLYDTGFGMCADYEVVTPRVPLPDFAPSRLWLPYGYWEFDDNSRVAFARDYIPMWRIDGGRSERLDPWDPVSGHAKIVHFTTLTQTLNWAGGRARELALAFLAEHRISELPRLLDVMPYMFESSVDSVSGAVARLQHATSHVETIAAAG